MRSEKLVIHPNLSAEEAKSQVPAAAQMLLESLGQLMWLLFDEEATCVDSPAKRPWPEALGPRQPGVAFAALEKSRGFFPWLPDEEGQAKAAELNLQLAFGPPEAQATLHDKGCFLRTLKKEAPHLLGLPPEQLLILDPDQCQAKSASSAVEKTLAQWPKARSADFTIKPRWGTSGRGRQRGRDGVVGDNVRRGLLRMAQRRGAVVEPWLHRLRDLSNQLWVHPDGQVGWLGSTELLVRANGQPLGNRGLVGALARGEALGLSGTNEDQTLADTAMQVGALCHAAGYSGPGGLDAFIYLDEGAERLRPTVEFNARLTTGILALGFLARAMRAGLCHKGDAWGFLLSPPPNWPQPVSAHVRQIPLSEASGSPLLLLANDAADLDPFLAG